MSDANRDLAALGLESCRAHLDEEFVRRAVGDPDVALRLIKVDTMPRDPRATGNADRPFSLLFRGPVDPRLTQGMHDLEHDVLPLQGLFLVPVGADEDGSLYEAVFT